MRGVAERWFFAEGNKYSNGEGNSVKSEIRDAEEIHTKISDVWRENEETAIYIGLSLNEYWNLNVHQFKKYVDVYQLRKENELKEQDFLNHILGKYLCFSFNDPKKYPKKAYLSKKDSYNKKMTDEEMEREAMKFIRR